MVLAKRRKTMPYETGGLDFRIKSKITDRCRLIYNQYELKKDKVLKRITILIFLAVFCFSQPIPSDAGWNDFKQKVGQSMNRAKDSVKDTGDRVKDKTRDAGNRFKENTRKKTEEWKQRGGDAVRRETDRARENIDRSTDRYREQTREVVDRKTEQVRDFARQHGQAAGNKMKEVWDKHGERSVNTMKETAARHGSHAAETVGDAIKRYGPAAGDDLKNAFDAAGGRGRDAVESAYKRWGVPAAQKIADSYRYYGPRVGQSVSSAYQKWGEKVGDSVRSTYHDLGEKYGDRFQNYLIRTETRITDSWNTWSGQAKSNFLDAYELHARPQFERISAAYRKYGPIIGAATAHAANRVHAAVRDPENQKKAVGAAITTCIIVHRLKTDGKHMAVGAVRNTCQNVTVVDSKGRRVSLERYCQNYIEEKHPYLADTTIGQDPVGAFTYVVVFNDVGYVTKEMKVIKGPGGDYMTMEDAMMMASPLDNNATIEYVETVEAFAILTDEDVNEEDVLAAAHLIEKANRGGAI